MTTRMTADTAAGRRSGCPEMRVCAVVIALSECMELWPLSSRNGIGSSDRAHEGPPPRDPLGGPRPALPAPPLRRDEPPGAGEAPRQLADLFVGVPPSDEVRGGLPRLPV